MAKDVMPPAELEPRPKDVDLPLSLYPKISFFTQLKTPPTFLAQHPGACRLRFYKEGEEICHHGDPGWSAFYLLTREDVETLRTHPARRHEQAPAEKAKQEVLLRRAEEGRSAAEAQLADPACPAKEQDGLKKKLSTLQKEIEKAQAALAELERELQDLPELRERFEQQIQPPPEPADRARLAAAGTDFLNRLQEQARARADQARLRELQNAVAAAAEHKRTLADAAGRADPDLARALRDLAQSEDGKQPVATVMLPPREEQAASGRGWLVGLWRQLFGRQGPAPRARPAYIPVDGPRDLDYHSRLATLYEGELFGEFACAYRTPRSATVRAERDCYVLEVMRNILDRVQKDPYYSKRMEEVVRRRLRETTLRGFSIFRELDEERLQDLSERVELLQCQPGTLLCDQHEESDCMYLIGSGMVKVMTGVSWLLPAAARLDGAALHADLLKPAPELSELARRLWGLLPADVQKGIEDATPGDLSKATANGLVRTLNRLISGPALWQAPEWAALVQARGLGRKVWARLARSGQGAPEALAYCNRLLLQAVDAQAFPAWQPPPEGERVSYLFQAEKIRDWKIFCGRLVADDKPEGEPVRGVWGLLPEAAREALRRGKAAELTAEQRAEVVAALNALVAGEPLLLRQEFHPNVLGKMRVDAKLLELFLPAKRRWTEYDFQRWNRAMNRLLLEAVCPRGLAGLPHPTGLQTVLAYRGRDESIGEMGLFEGAPRSATAVTYNHPDDDPGREVGPVTMVRISKELFGELLAQVPSVRARVAEVVAARHAEDRQRLARPAAGLKGSALPSGRAEELGLVQGQRLMLIDLDRCTRCDECVRACVSTHDDGRSRLFLNGPQVERYLVPTTCRSCLDPVCMIGCPVGSIHRGNIGDILIEDWCIGCGKCAQQCPYGAIQMHDVGALPLGAQGWHFRAADPNGADAGMRPDSRDADWAVSRAPFLRNRSLMEGLGLGGAGAQWIWFRREFDVPGTLPEHGHALTLNLVSPDAEARVWLNGVELKTEERVKRTKWGPSREFTLSAGGALRPRGNRIMAQVNAAAAAPGELFFDLRIDPVRRLESLDLDIKAVTDLAVVCDLCNSLETGPACVTACPHEAAMRIDAPRLQFPERV